MKRFFNILSPFLPYGVLGLLLIILFWQVFFLGNVFIDGDNFHLNIPLKYILVDAVKQGFFPFWNPYILAGTPYAADLNLGTFNPLNILYFLFPVPRALTIQAIVELFLIGSFQYLFLKQRLQKWIALFGGIVFMLSGTVFIFISNISVLHVIVYIPLLFLLVEKYFQTKKLKFFIFLICTQVLQIVSGHPQISYYSMLFIVFFILFQNNLFLKKRLFIGFIYIFTSVLLASFQLVPFFEYVMNSTRPAGSLSYASSGSLTLSHVLTMFFPTFFGTKLYGDWWGSQIMLFGYIGIAALCFLFIGLLYPKFKNKNYYVFSFILSFLLSLGKWGGIYFVFYFLVPGWSAFRSPGDMFVLTTFFATIFASFGFDYLLRNRKQFYAVGKYIVVSSLSFLFVCSTVWYLTTHVVHWTQILVLLSFVHMPYVSKILFYDSTKIQSMLNGIMINIVLFFSFALIFGYMLWKILPKKNLFIVYIIIFASVNLLLFDRTYILLAPLSFYNSSIVKLPLINENYRIFSKPVVVAQDRRFLPGPFFFFQESKLNLVGITDNHAVQSHMQSITGYTSLVLKNYQNFIGGKNVTGIDTKKLSLEKLNELSVAYVLGVKNGQLFVQKNDTVLPRARLVHPESGTVSLSSIGNPNKVVTTTFLQKPDMLILADNYYPGWEATVNGKKVSITIYNNIFRQISIPKGKSNIVFTYNPLSWKIGIAFSFIGIMFLILLPRFRKFYE